LISLLALISYFVSIVCLDRFRFRSRSCRHVDPAVTSRSQAVPPEITALPQTYWIRILIRPELNPEMAILSASTRLVRRELLLISVVVTADVCFGGKAIHTTKALGEARPVMLFSISAAFESVKTVRAAARRALRPDGEVVGSLISGRGSVGINCHRCGQASAKMSQVAKFQLWRNGSRSHRLAGGRHSLCRETPGAKNLGLKIPGKRKAWRPAPWRPPGLALLQG
jgi:hypothetical protein